MKPDPPALATLRSQARLAAQSGSPMAAHSAYSALLKAHPDDVEGLNFLGVLDLAQGHVAQALQMLERALEIAPSDGPTLKNLGVALLQSGNPERAHQVLAQALADAPDFFVARLHLGAALERLDLPREALGAYFRALSSAQSEGLWLSPASTPAGLRPAVEHATRFVQTHHRRLLAAVLQPLHARYGHEAMTRVDRCLAGYLGDANIRPKHPEQRPTFLYFPDLPATPFLPRELFPWYEEMESRTDAIRDELMAVLATDADLEPFLGEPPPGMTSQYLGGSSNTKPQWDGLFFHRHGKRNEENCRRCPATAAALDATPTVRIRGHAPESLFSVLGAGSHILPHTGVTNTRVVTHLPLLVPGDCTLRVADQRHDWQQGLCITFDDTFEHEAWNKSEKTRVILLFDVWNPHMTQVEQLAITDLVVAIAELKGDQL